MAASLIARARLADLLEGSVSEPVALILCGWNNRCPLLREIKRGAIKYAAPEIVRGKPRRRIKLRSLVPFALITQDSVAAAQQHFAAVCERRNASPKRRKLGGAYRPLGHGAGARP